MAPIEEKMRENYLRWFEHLGCRPLSAPITKCDDIILNQAIGKDKVTWTSIIQKI